MKEARSPFYEALEIPLQLTNKVGRAIDKVRAQTFVEIIESQQTMNARNRKQSSLRTWRRASLEEEKSSGGVGVNGDSRVLQQASSRQNVIIAPSDPALVFNIHQEKAPKRTESHAIKKPIRCLHLGWGKRCATQAALKTHVSREHRALGRARAGKCPVPDCTY